MAKIIPGFLLFIFLYGCDYPCRNNPINPAFIGFSPGDIDTFVLRAYKPNNNYQQLIDTVLVINKYASIYTTTGDTTIVYVNSSNPNDWISPGFDWQIYLPAKNRTFSISGISSENLEGRKNCLNPITSFSQDGQVIFPQITHTGLFYTSGYISYLRN